MAPSHDGDEPNLQAAIPEEGGGGLRFGDRRFHGPAVGFVFALLLLALTVPPLLLRLRSSPPPETPAVTARDSVAPPEVAIAAVRVARPETLRYHIERLRQTRLWELPRDDFIQPVLFDRYPAEAGKLSDIPTKKRLFLHTLLPAALVAVNEIRQERARLDAILDEIDRCGGPGTTDDDFDTSASFNACLAPEEMEFLDNLCRKYRSRSLEQLRRRVNILPVSLIMAQGALESSWGGSRFASSANNIFGMWTWDEDGMVPRAREEGKLHKIRTYESILDSVRHYLLTINRHEAYNPLRMIRLQTFDSLALTEGLTLYSERGGDYIEDLKEVIRYNNLQRYDRYRLARMPEPANNEARP